MGGQPSSGGTVLYRVRASLGVKVESFTEVRLCRVNLFSSLSRCHGCITRGKGRVKVFFSCFARGFSVHSAPLLPGPNLQPGVILRMGKTPIANMWVCVRVCVCLGDGVWRGSCFSPSLATWRLETPNRAAGAKPCAPVGPVPTESIWVMLI
jgi:hypothetical protein